MTLPRGTPRRPGHPTEERLLALRADDTIGDAAFQRVEEELDWAELGWAQVLPPERGAGRRA